MNISNDDLLRVFTEVQSFGNTNGTDSRYRYAKARQKDSWYFIKIALSSEYEEGLEREYLWSEFMERVSVLMPSLNIDGPKIHKRIGREAIVFHWIEAPLVAERWDVLAWERNLDRYAELHVQLDRAAGDYSLPKVYTTLSHRDIAGAAWKQWVDNHVDEPTIAAAQQLFREHEKQVTLRLQHGDMSPWQIFDIGGIWVIFDGEKAGIDWPRFNDVAQSYVRLHNIARRPDLAKRFLAQFVDVLGMDRGEFYSQFIPVLVIQAVGYLADADVDKEHEAFHAEAHTLVDVCLSRDINQLF